MNIKELIESSPDTPLGSVSRDLVISKLWLCTALQTLGLTKFDKIYVLGSWYGATAIVIKSLPFIYQEIICIDEDYAKVEYFDNIINEKGWTDVVSVCDDANAIPYRGNDILVINTSTNDMPGTKWLDIIPEGSIVVLQGKDQQEESNGIETLNALDEAYPLSETLMLKELEVVDVHGEPYYRFMKIGIK